MKKIIISITVIVVIASAFFIYRSKKASKSNTSISTYQVKRGDITITITASGLVLPENRLEIKPPVAGRIDEILVKEGATVKKGEILAWMSSTERAALLDAASAKGQKEFTKWSSFYKAIPIMAPITGTIIQRGVEPGQSFTPSDSILTMSDRLVIKAQVDETDIAQVKIGQTASIILDAYPNRPLTGVVHQVAYEAKTVSNVTTYQVTVIPDSVPDFMKSGMTISAEFITHKKTDVLLIPTVAINLERGKQLVSLKKENSFESKEITAGVNDGLNTEVENGLKDGDIILLKRAISKNKKSAGDMGQMMPRRMR